MEEKEFDFINVIPFIDIMLVLLTIVLTTSTLIAQGVIPIQLPQASQVNTQTLKTLSIEINRVGTIFFNGRAVSLADLAEILHAHDRQTPILIRADKNLVLQHFVRALDMVKTAGFSHISLQTESAS